MDTNIYIITQEQRGILVNSQNEYIKFDPIQDINDNYIISENEFNLISGLQNCPTELLFIKDLIISVYKPKEYIKKFTYVGLLTQEQMYSIIGKEYTTDSYFNPLQDLNDNWVISVEEMEFCTNIEYLWVKDLPLIIYEPKLAPPLS